MWSVSPRYSQKCSAHNQFMENDLVSWGLWKARPPIWASLVAQMVKRLSTMRETRVWSLGWKDPLEKEMATHSSNVAWKIPWTEEPGGLQSMGSQRVRHDWATYSYSYTVKGFGIVNKAEIDVFLVLSCFFHDPVDVGNLISGFLPFLNPAWISGISQFT